MKILGIRIDNLSKKEILEKIGFFLGEEKFHQIVTINPEFVLRAQSDREFKNVLDASALSVADGVGIWYAFLRFGNLLRARFAGADLMHEILCYAYMHNKKVFLVVSKRGLSSLGDITAALEGMYPTLEIRGMEADPDDLLSCKGKNIDSDVLLCNFGAPWQELFINSVRNDRIRIAMGVGGSFDFVTGKVRRAPRLMRLAGLEWLWRLILEPRYRLKRVWNAFPVFAWRVLINR